MASGKIETPITDEPVSMRDSAPHTEGVTTLAPISDADSPARLAAVLVEFFESVRAIYGNKAKVAVIVATPLDGDTYHFHINANDPGYITAMVGSAAAIVAGQAPTLKAN